MLPIVKYDGELWYYDKRLNELRNIYTAERRRLDSGMVEAYYFDKMIIAKQLPITIYDADKTEDDENHVPHVLRKER